MFKNYKKTLLNFFLNLQNFFNDLRKQKIFNLVLLDLKK